MNKFIFVILLISFNAFSASAPRKPLTFQVQSSITSEELDYKISKVSFFPDSVFLKFDEEIDTFVSTELSLQVDTNIPVDEGADNFTYSFQVIKNESICVNRDDEEVVDTIRPHILFNDLVVDKGDIISALTFEDEVGGYLSDENKIVLKFDEFEELARTIKTCSGSISVEVGVDI